MTLMKVKVFRGILFVLILSILIGFKEGLQSKAIQLSEEKNMVLQMNNEDNTQKKSAILIAPFNSKDFKGYSKIEEIEYILKNNDWEVDSFIDDEVSINCFKELSNYDLILIETHGTDESNLLSGKKYNMFHKISHFFKLDNKEECVYCENKDLIKSGDIIEDDRNLIITSEFIRKYNEGFNNSIVLINACYSSKNKELYEAFFENEALYFWGNTGAANIGVGSGTMEMIVENVVNKKCSQDKIYDYLQNEVVTDEGKPIGTALKYKFNNNINELQLIKNKNIINSSFTEETSNKENQDIDKVDLDIIINNAREKIQNYFKEDAIYCGNDIEAFRIIEEKANQLGYTSQGLYFENNYDESPIIFRYDRDTESIILVAINMALLIEDDLVKDITAYVYDINESKENAVNIFIEELNKKKYISSIDEILKDILEYYFNEAFQYQQTTWSGYDLYEIRVNLGKPNYQLVNYMIDKEGILYDYNEFTNNNKLIVIREDYKSENSNNIIDMSDDNLDFSNFKDSYYTSYSGVKYAYPEFLTEDKINTTDNSITFYSPGKSIKLKIYSSNNYKDISVDNMYNNYLSSHINIDLNVIKNDKFTVSGEVGDNIYYYSAVINNTVMEYFEIIYPKKYINEFNSIVQKLYECLKLNNNTLQEKIIGKWMMEGEEGYTLTITNSTFGENQYQIDSIEGSDTVYISSDEYKWCINIIDYNKIHIFWYNPANGFYTRGTSYYRIEQNKTEEESSVKESIISHDKLWSILGEYTGSGIGIKDFTYDDDHASKETINYNGRTCWKFENIDRNGNLIGHGIIIDIFTGEHWSY